MPIPIVTAAQMRSIEERADAMGIPSSVLMEHAGAAVARAVLRRLAETTCGDTSGRRVLVLVGPGNNGGDGLVAARYLHDAGLAVSLYIWKRDLQRPDPNFALVQERGVPYTQAQDDAQHTSLETALHGHGAGDVVLDALLGTGRSRPVEPDLAAILDLVNIRRRNTGFQLVALDLPTGLNSDTGEADPHILQADATITLGYPKTGLYLFPGAAAAGTIEIVDIGIPAGQAGAVGLEMITPADVRSRVPKRPLNSNKGTFGKVLVVAGSLNYTGAPYLAATAAGRIGAGLVTLALARAIHPILAARIGEATFLPLPDDEGALSMDGLSQLQEQMQTYTATLIGPGLGRHPATQQLVLAAIRRTPHPFVLDADGLNALAAGLQESGHADLFPHEAAGVLTPHPGELGRILGSDAQIVETDRLAAIRAAVERTGQVVVLKGAHTLVAAPGTTIWLNPVANPALATAGTGDVLAGTIAGLLAQGLAPLDAALCGVYLHAAAGLLASSEYGEAGVLAGDLLPLLPQALQAVRAGVGRR